MDRILPQLFIYKKMEPCWFKYEAVCLIFLILFFLQQVRLLSFQNSYLNNFKIRKIIFYLINLSLLEIY